MMRKFIPEEICPPRDGFTISRNTGLNGASWFSLGRDTSISAETYERDCLYFCHSGAGEFRLGEEKRKAEIRAGQLLIVKSGTLCGVAAEQKCLYTEIMAEKEIEMNELVKAGEVLQLKNLIQYETDSIVNLDIIKNDQMKFVVMAFAEGTGLQPHRAPGDAIVFALEGRGIIGYEGEEYTLEEGECFRFEKNGLHSVKADGNFKMALLLVLA